MNTAKLVILWVSAILVVSYPIGRWFERYSTVKANATIQPNVESRKIEYLAQPISEKNHEVIATN